MRLFVLFTLAFLCAGTVAVPGPLTDAAKNGDTKQIAKLLEGGADVNEPGFATPLLMAALFGHVEAVELLLANGADAEVSTSIGTPLHAAAQRGHADVIRALLASRASTESRDKKDLTPLMLASFMGQLTAVEALLEGGADPNSIAMGNGNDSGGVGRVNALHLALLEGHNDIGARLRGAGAIDTLTKENVAEMLALGDAGRGRDLALTRCGQCHKVLSEDEVVTHPKRGLSLIGVFGREIGTVESYEYYSDALKGAGGVWTAELLYTFATDAMLTFPGTSMNWHDGWTDEEAADIVAYFKSVEE